MKIIDAAAALQLYTSKDASLLLAGLPDHLAEQLDTAIRTAAFSGDSEVSILVPGVVAKKMNTVLTSLGYNVSYSTQPDGNCNLRVSWSSIILSH